MGEIKISHVKVQSLQVHNSRSFCSVAVLHSLSNYYGINSNSLSNYYRINSNSLSNYYPMNLNSLSNYYDINSTPAEVGLRSRLK